MFLLAYARALTLQAFWTDSRDTLWVTAPSSLYPILSVDTEATWKNTGITFSAHRIYTQSDVTKSVLQAVKGLCITVSDFYIVFSLSDSGPEIHVQRWGCCGTKQMDMLFFRLVQSHPSAWRERTASCGWSGVSGNREWEILSCKTISGLSCSSIYTQASNAWEVKEIPLHWVLASYR